MVTSAQLRAARSLLNWTVRDLAEKAGVHRNTITRAETEATAQGHAVAQIVRTLESAGVEFIDFDGRPGVRLKTRDGAVSGAAGPGKRLEVTDRRV
jgi:transcriptional regulator with XRE-family HTH domain